MLTEKINRVSGRVVTGLSLLALLTVISGYFQAPQADEGTAAHIFQISIVLIVPTIALFLVTADWKEPARPTADVGRAGSCLVAGFRGFVLSRTLSIELLLRGF